MNKQSPTASNAKLFAAYKAAFESTFQGKSVEIVKGKSENGSSRFNVVIDGDKGARPMSVQEIAEAVEMFQR